MKQAWRSLALSTLLLAIAWLTFTGLRSSENNQSRTVYVWIFWLFIGRFVWSLWKYGRARREVSSFRTGVERQLKLTGMPKD